MLFRSGGLIWLYRLSRIQLAIAIGIAFAIAIDPFSDFFIFRQPTSFICTAKISAVFRFLNFDSDCESDTDSDPDNSYNRQLRSAWIFRPWD